MRKIILTILVTAMMLGILSACTKAENNNENLNSGNGVSNSETMQPTETTPGTTEPVSSYQPGKWTIAGYTSEWLNMSYIRPGSLKITQDSIAIQKQFDELRKADDPYWAVTEMTFKGVFDIKDAPVYLITLTVMLLENADKTAKECADEHEREMKAAAIELGVKRDILDEKEAEVIFLGERYLVRYTKTRTLGRDREHCRLYLVKDGYCVILTYEHLSNYFILENTFYGFSTLNGDDYKTTCSICGKEVIYEVVATGGAACLGCCFDGQTKQPENDQTEQETTAPTIPSSQAPVIAPIEGPTEEPATTPTTQPPATQSPVACSHNYANATCTAPKTCTTCGVTTGSVLGHTWKDATCTVPKTCTLCSETSGTASGHSWNDITETVHHEELGHYEDVEVAKTVQKVKCYACSNKSNTPEEYYSHFDSVHGNSNHYLLVRERYEWVDDRVYEYETKWIVDQEAYTETVVIGRNCRICGEEE